MGRPVALASGRAAHLLSQSLVAAAVAGSGLSGATVLGIPLRTNDRKVLRDFPDVARPLTAV